MAVSWQDQGRQGHGWFGSGTASAQRDDRAGDAKRFEPGGLQLRIAAIAYGAIASLPPALRRRAEARLGAAGLSRLTEVMTAWVLANRLDQASFAEHFLGRSADDPVAANLRSAAQGADMATTHAELRDAAGHLADAMQAVGLDRWAAFLTDAHDRARDPATTAAVGQSSSPPNLGKDAIRPVYPLETLLGIGAAGFARGVAAAVRAAAGAGLRQVTPPKPQSALDAPTETAPGSPAASRILAGQQGKHVAGSRNYIPRRSTLTANPETLLTRFSGRGRQVGRIPV